MAKKPKKMRIALLGLGSENRALLELAKTGRLDAEIEIKGRHDPAIPPRMVPVAEAMVAIVLADHLLRQRMSRL